MEPAPELAHEFLNSLQPKVPLQGALIASGEVVENVISARGKLLIIPFTGATSSISMLDAVVLREDLQNTVSTVYTEDLLKELAQGRVPFRLQEGEAVFLGLTIPMPDKIFYAQDLESVEPKQGFANHSHWYRIYLPY